MRGQLFPASFATSQTTPGLVQCGKEHGVNTDSKDENMKGCLVDDGCLSAPGPAFGNCSKGDLTTEVTARLLFHLAACRCALRKLGNQSLR